MTARSLRSRGARFDSELFALRPWYHDFSVLGFDTTFLDVPVGPREGLGRAVDFAGGRLRRLWRGRRTDPCSGDSVRSPREIFRRTSSSHRVNQPVKDRHIVGLLRHALSDLPPSPDCLELFCADGYYSCRLKALQREASVTGVDLDEAHVVRARTMARRLDLQETRFLHEDVWTFLGVAPGPFDLVLCAGGLYHIADPRRLLEEIGRVCRGWVVIQSVVTLETESRDYCAQPPPGWTHGCRFTHAWLCDQVSDLGWQIEEDSRAELPGNPKLSDRGSSFLLCRVAQERFVPTRRRGSTAVVYARRRW